MRRGAIGGVGALLVVLALLAVGDYLPRWLAPTPGESPPQEVRAESRMLGWSDPEDVDELARDLYERVNDERAARGIDPLEWHDDLAELARSWSARMIDDRFEHSPDAYRTHPDFLTISENLAMGYSSLGEVHGVWMRSDEGRINILHPLHTTIGVGIVCRSDGRLWATQLYGAIEESTRELAEQVPAREPIVRPEPGPPCPLELEGRLGR